MTTQYPEVMEKVARVFGARVPSGETLSESALPYNMRKRRLAQYYQGKATEGPSSRKAAIGGGALLGSGVGLAALLSAKRGQPKALLDLLAAGGGGALLGGGAGLMARSGDKRKIRDAQNMLRRGSGGLDDDMVRRIRGFRRAQAAKRTIDAAAPAAIEQHGKSQRAKMQMADNAASRASRERMDETSRRSNLLSSLRGNSGAESAARGHFGKSLGELNARELAVVKGSLEKTSHLRLVQ